MTTAIKLDFDFDSALGESVAHYRAPNGNLYRVRAIQDCDAESPRDWCNTAVMACNHRRYNLGDDSGLDMARAAVMASRFYRETWEDSESGTFRHGGRVYDCFDLSHGPDIWAAIQLCEDIEVMPLYLFDHSGLSISTGRFSCPWDSGQVGFAFIARAQLESAMNKTRWTPALRDWARRAIESETAVYDSYLSGQVYGFCVERLTAAGSDWGDVDSCWGYYGDFDESGLAEAAAESIAYDIESRQRTRLSRLADLIRNRVPLEKRAALLA